MCPLAYLEGSQVLVSHALSLPPIQGLSLDCRPPRLFSFAWILNEPATALITAAVTVRLPFCHLNPTVSPHKMEAVVFPHVPLALGKP